jgi:hypothetical protein
LYFPNQNDFILGEIRNIKNNLPISGANNIFHKRFYKKLVFQLTLEVNQIKVLLILTKPNYLYWYEDFTITNIQIIPFFMKKKAIDLESVVIRKRKEMSLVESLPP